VRDYEREIAKQAKKNPKAFYRFVNGRLKTRAKIADLKTEDGSDVTTDDEKAQMFNAYFCSVYTKEDLQSIPSKQCDDKTNILSDIDIDETEVFELLKKLQPDKSPGADGIHPRVLKECAAELSMPLTKLFRQSLAEGRLPESWKKANISPIFKKGNRSSVANYRPISLTSVCSKLMEKIIRNALLRHMIDNSYLSDYQHGFVHGRSCTTQLLKVVDKWTEILDQGGTIDAVYLDFAKAFDAVPHQRLLVKLAGYGVSGHVFEWIQHFLVDRTQRVGVAGTYSAWAGVISGVPQGTVWDQYCLYVISTICQRTFHHLFSCTPTIQRSLREQIVRKIESHCRKTWINLWNGQRNGSYRLTSINVRKCTWAELRMSGNTTTWFVLTTRK